MRTAPESAEVARRGRRLGLRKILFVCAGNLCRSPMALVVARALQPAFASAFDAAGTQVGRPGEKPDPRAVAVLQRRGYAVPRLRTRPVTLRDLQRHDLVLAMDRLNLNTLRANCPPADHGKLQLFLDAVPGMAGCDVPDPYWGNVQGFERVLDLCEAGVHALLQVPA